MSSSKSIWKSFFVLFFLVSHWEEVASAGRSTEAAGHVCSLSQLIVPASPAWDTTQLRSSTGRHTASHTRLPPHDSRSSRLAWKAECCPPSDARCAAGQAVTRMVLGKADIPQE